MLEQDELEQSGFEQRPAVHLVSTPGREIQAEDGGWSSEGLVPGTGGEATLKTWLGWERGREFEAREDGALVGVLKSKL